MNTSILVMALALVSASQEVQPDALEQRIISHASTKKEGLQFVEVTRSLRNQRLLEQQAESLARQYQFRLQAAQAANALRLLEKQDAEAPHSSLENYHLHAVLIHNGSIEARLGKGRFVFPVRDNQVLGNGIRVTVRNNYVELSRGNEYRKLELSY